MYTGATLRQFLVGTRGSQLSLAQTTGIVSLLKIAHPKTNFRIVEIATAGDRDKTTPLHNLQRGVFVKDIETALLNGEIDLAVHSAKDLSIHMPDKLRIGAVPKRHDPRDVLVNRWGTTLNNLPKSTRLGTSSPRREAQIKAIRPDIVVLPIRGNVDTRLEKIGGSVYDGVVVAAAGLLRLGLKTKISEFLPIRKFTPEAGQGTLVIQIRSDDQELLNLVKGLSHKATTVAFRAERAFSVAIGSGCTVPMAAYAKVEYQKLHIEGMMALPDENCIVRDNLIGEYDKPESSGQALADQLTQSYNAEIKKGD